MSSCASSSCVGAFSLTSSSSQASIECPSIHLAKSQTRLSDFPFTFHFHALEKGMATYSSVLAWRIPGMEEPGGVYGVTQSWTRLKWLSSSSSSIHLTSNGIYLEVASDSIALGLTPRRLPPTPRPTTSNPFDANQKSKFVTCVSDWWTID